MKCTNMEIVTLENIKELVSQTETEQIEFKKSLVRKSVTRQNV